MLSIKYIGSHEYELVFDSKKKIILTGDEILQIVEQHEDALCNGGTENHGKLLHEQGTEQPLHKDWWSR